MNGRLRKEDWWILVITISMLGIAGLFAAVGNSNDGRSIYRECFDKDGELVYFDRSGYKCVKKGVFLDENS